MPRLFLILFMALVLLAGCKEKYPVFLTPPVPTPSTTTSSDILGEGGVAAPPLGPGYEAVTPSVAPPTPVPDEGFIWPVTWFDYISTYYSSWYHPAIDLAAAYGTPVLATRSGAVVYVSANYYGCGFEVRVQHDNGAVSTYCHLSEVWVGQGSWVYQGEGLGTVGSTGYSTGPHLHFGLSWGDPLAYLP